jgi:hypothetical protein
LSIHFKLTLKKDLSQILLEELNKSYDNIKLQHNEMNGLIGTATAWCDEILNNLTNILLNLQNGLTLFTNAIPSIPH